MDNNGNLHAGHRERMFNKLMSNPDAFSDHELLETLLFYFLPRKNTNELAHKLLRSFGSIEKVVSASAEELKSVDGVGDKVAAALILVGRLMSVIYVNKQDKPYLLNIGDVKETLKKLFVGEKKEKFLLILLDRRYKLITKIEFCDNNMQSVTADIPEIAKVLALHKSAYALIAHNHPSGSVQPSENDDLTTRKINVLCDVHGVALIDHFIFAGEDFYSYNFTGRLSAVKEVADLDKILKGQGELI